MPFVMLTYVKMENIISTRTRSPLMLAIYMFTCQLFWQTLTRVESVDSCKFEPRTPGPFDRLAKSHMLRAEVTVSLPIHEARLKLQAQSLYTIRHGKEHFSRQSKI